MADPRGVKRLAGLPPLMELCRALGQGVEADAVEVVAFSVQKKEDGK
jgi:hypothetical protein